MTKASHILAAAVENLELAVKNDPNYDSIKDIPEDYPELLKVRKIVAESHRSVDYSKLSKTENRRLNRHIYALHQQGYSNSEIAGRVGIQTSSVYGRLSRMISSRKTRAKHK